MRITNLLTASTIKLNLQAASKDQIIEELAQVLVDAGKVSDKAAYVADLQAREALSSTGIGEGIAIPHAKSAAVSAPAIAFGRQLAGVDYDSLDGQPAKLFFMIAANEGANNDHLETLSKLATFLMDPEFNEKMMTASTKEDILAAIEAKEGVEVAEDAPVIETAPIETTTNKRILAVTACPTGIAHTFMAAEKLQTTAAQKNVAMKVETKVKSEELCKLKSKVTVSSIS